MKRSLVLDVVGLTPALLRSAMPQLSRWAEQRCLKPLVPSLPAVTCTVQASMLTGVEADGGGQGPGHGAVANGWYFRDLAEIWLWRQSCELITAGGALTTVFDRWRDNHPGSLSAQSFWWWNLPSRADLSLTPRPNYWADGRKSPGLHAHPAALGQRLQQDLGPFPLFQFWGPGAGLPSTRWIAAATRALLRDPGADLTLAYLPHLDYDLQRFGPDGAEARAAAAALDPLVMDLITDAEADDIEVVVLSEYGIEAVDQPILPNRRLRQLGWLTTHPAANGDLLDPGNSLAFAVCDHQFAHVYVADPARIAEIADALGALPGVEQVRCGRDRAVWGLDHPRSGEVVLMAEVGAWFAYPWWIDGDRIPDFARTVDIHRKPGYDPCELFLDPQRRWLKARILGKLLAKKAGFRTLLDVVPLDPTLVRGSHGRPPSSADQGPLWIGPEAWSGTGSEVAATAALAAVGTDY